jgi:hypothetical protein
MAQMIRVKEVIEACQPGIECEIYDIPSTHHVVIRSGCVMPKTMRQLVAEFSSVSFEDGQLWIA